MEACPLCPTLLFCISARLTWSRPTRGHPATKRSGSSSFVVIMPTNQHICACPWLFLGAGRDRPGQFVFIFFFASSRYLKMSYQIIPPPGPSPSAVQVSIACVSLTLGGGTNTQYLLGPHPPPMSFANPPHAFASAPTLLTSPLGFLSFSGPWLNLIKTLHRLSLPCLLPSAVCLCNPAGPCPLLRERPS